MKLRLLYCLSALLSVQAVSQSPPLGVRPPVAGERTKVLTIGTFHLAEQKDLNAIHLAPLLDKLAAFRPTVITYEGVSGEQCAAMKAFQDLYADAFENYCWDQAKIEESTGFSVPAALAEIRKTFENWPPSPTPAQRRRLAMLFVAAGDRPSAQVQWLRLASSERRVGDGVDEAILKILQRTNSRKNENYEIAAALAARLGLERVYPVDDHSSDGTLAHAPLEFGQSRKDHFERARRSALFAEHQRDMASIINADTLLAYYRKINAPGALIPQIQGDFGAAIAADDGGPWGRRYVGWWEVRNLRMAANIRATFVNQPGARVLNIVGSSHKPWYDALMGLMADVEVVAAEEVLR